MYTHVYMHIMNRSTRKRARESLTMSKAVVTVSAILKAKTKLIQGMVKCL